MSLWTDIIWKIRRPVPPPPSYRLPPSGVHTTYLPAGYRIEDKGDAKETGCKVYESGGRIVIDGQFAVVLDGRKQRGDGGQSEKQDPLARCMVPVHFRRCFVRNNRNALLLFSDSIVEDCIWLNVGEDAVANRDRDTHTQVIGCTFLNSVNGDKSIQLNGAHDAVIKDNTIYLGCTGIRVGESSYSRPDRDEAIIWNNRFVGVDTGIHPSACSVDLAANRFEQCRKDIKLAAGAKLV